MFSLSDLMGDQTIDAQLSVQGSIRDANVYLSYGWLPWQTDLRATVYHTSTFTGDLLTESGATLYDDQRYGASVAAIRPFSLFHRVAGEVEWGGITRTAMVYDSSGNLVDVQGSPANRDLQWIRTSGEWVFDNVLWGPTGPWDGVRANLSGNWMPPLLQSDFGYARAKLDARAYFPTGKLSSIAVRGAVGESFRAGGGNPHRFLLGSEAPLDGYNLPFNWHFNENNTGTGIDEIYFGEIDAPLRGYRYDQFRGNKMAVGSLELRFPLVEEIRFGVLLPPLRYIMCSIFVDAGTAWTSHEVVDQGGIGMGWGLRMNLGAFILRWSQAWPLTEPAGAPGNLQPPPIDGSFQYWSLGADF